MTPALRTAQRVRLFRHIGTAARRRRVPRARFPHLVESDYAQAIVNAVVEPGRRAIAPLLEALPQLLGQAHRARHDEDETQRAKALLDRARQATAIQPHQVDGMATRAAQQVSIHHRGEFARQTKAALGVEVPTSDHRIPALVRHFVAENAALIKSLGARPPDEIEKIVTRAFTTGQTVETITAEITARYDIAERHARLIARDQVGKLRGQIAEARHREIGIASFRWRSMEDPLVRPAHKIRNGTIYRYDEPHPVPGEEICCRCGEEPMFDEIMATLDALLAS